jgi:hypothetical protein
VCGSCHVMAFGGVNIFPFHPISFHFPFFFQGCSFYFYFFLIIHTIHSILTPSTRYLPEQGRDTAARDGGTSVLPCRGEQRRVESSRAESSRAEQSRSNYVRVRVARTYTYPPTYLPIHPASAPHSTAAHGYIHTNLQHHMFTPPSPISLS